LNYLFLLEKISGQVHGMDSMVLMPPLSACATGAPPPCEVGFSFLENAVPRVITFIAGFNFLVPDMLDMLDCTAASRFFSRPAGFSIVGRAGRIMQQADFIDSALKLGDLTNG
jgi:hypothetical protein